MGNAMEDALEKSAGINSSPSKAASPEPERKPYFVRKAFSQVHTGSILALTDAQAKSAGDSVRPASDREVGCWGRDPIRLD